MAYFIPIRRVPVYTSEARLFAQDLDLFTNGDGAVFALSFTIQYDAMPVDTRDFGLDTKVWIRNRDTGHSFDMSMAQAPIDIKRALGGAVYGISHCSTTLRAAGACVHDIGTGIMNGLTFEVLCLRSGLFIFSEYLAMTLRDSLLDRDRDTLDQVAVNTAMCGLIDTNCSTHETLCFAQDVNALTIDILHRSNCQMPAEYRFSCDPAQWRVQLPSP